MNVVAGKGILIVKGQPDEADYDEIARECAKNERILDKLRKTIKKKKDRKKEKKRDKKRKKRSSSSSSD